MKHPIEVRLAWRVRAECLDMDPDLFFPDWDERSTVRALNVCKECAVRTPCLEDALAYGLNQQYGVRGGKTPNQRKRIIRDRERRGPGRPRGASCGTTTGYRRGCRCADCTEAQVNYQVRYRERLRGRRIPESSHGTQHGYRNYGCRCDACREANREAQRRSRRKARLA